MPFLHTTLHSQHYYYTKVKYPTVPKHLELYRGGAVELSYLAVTVRFQSSEKYRAYSG